MKYLPVTIDFETTNKEPKDAHPVEFAVVDSFGHLEHQLIKPPIPIPPETSAIHHIIDADVENAISWEVAQEHINNFLSLRMKATGTDAILLIAHNAKYEQTILRNTSFIAPVQWVCTYKCAMYTYSTAPSYSNEGLRYWIPVTGLGRSHSQHSHSALHDCQVTMQLFKNFETRMSVEDMIRVTKEPAHYPRMPFGKWRSYAWEKIPTDYLQWLLRQSDMEPDIKACAKRELELRRHKNANARSS